MRWQVVAAIVLCTVVMAAHGNGNGNDNTTSPRPRGVVDADEQAFTSWKRTFGKSYTSVQEHATRKAVFAANVAFVRAHNGQRDRTFDMAVNAFADLTSDEFRAMITGTHAMPVSGVQHRKPRLATGASPTPLPSTVDWTTQGVVTPVKNQGLCGAGWAFSATGAIESLRAILHGTLGGLSEQELLDCVPLELYNHGCSGGYPTGAFQYTARSGGLASEASYPYTASVHACHPAAPAPGTAITGFMGIPHYSDDALAAAIAQQPVSVGVKADEPAFQFYSGGVFSAPCGPVVNHGMLAVGYTPTSWKLKNSWGTSWGEGGYMRLARVAGCANDDDAAAATYGLCGILTYGNYPFVGVGGVV